MILLTISIQTERQMHKQLLLSKIVIHDNNRINNQLSEPHNKLPPQPLNSTQLNSIYTCTCKWFTSVSASM